MSLKVVKKPGRKIRRRTAPILAAPTRRATPNRSIAQTNTGTVLRFPANSDIAVVWDEVQKGGSSRREVVARLHERFRGQTTRSGNPKPVSTVLNQVLARARAAGYTIESAWRVVAPDGARGGTSEPEPSTQDAKRSVKLTKRRRIAKAQRRE